MTKKQSHQERQAAVYAALPDPSTQWPLRPALEADFEHLKYTKRPVALALSGGLDSQVLAFSLHAMGVNFQAYTFALKGKPSRDLKYAKLTADKLGVPHNTVWLPTEPKPIYRFLATIIEREPGNLTKSFVTCMWASMTLVKRLAVSNVGHVLFGLGSDQYFAMSRRWGQMVRTLNVPIEEVFSLTMRNPDEQVIALRNLAAESDMSVITPYYTSQYLACMIGPKYSYDEANKPREKELLRRDYDDYLIDMGIKVPVHQSYQLGDTGISEFFETTLLNSPLNDKDYKDAGALIRHIAADTTKLKALCK